MSPQPMPPAEVALSTGDVAALLSEQHPELATEEIEVMGQGWDNLLFRVGEAHIARFPRRGLAVDLVRHESRWLPELAPALPLRIPAPVFLGEPGHGYPWPWTIVPFIEGEPAGDTTIDSDRTARALGDFLRCLHQPAPDDAPLNPYRGMHISERDAVTTKGLTSLAQGKVRESLGPVWDRARRADPWKGPRLWLHGDLHPQNILIIDEAPSGVIDFGDITSGDPATDLAVGWMLFDDTPRGRFFDSYGEVDAQLLVRARGWALSLAVSYLAHGADSAVMTRIGSRTLERVVSDPE